MQELVILGGAASAFSVAIAFLRFKHKREQKYRLQSEPFISEELSKFDGTTQEDALSRSQKSVIRFFRSKLLFDVAPSVACLAITSKWLATHEVITGKKGENAKLWLVPLYLSALSSCVYLVMHNLGRDISFYPETLRTFNEIVIYNTIRSACHGLSIILLLTVHIARAGVHFFPGFSFHRGLDRYPEDFYHQNAKAWVHIILIWAVWVVASAFAILALWRDILAWDERNTKYIEVRKLQREEDDLNKRITKVVKYIEELERLSWGDTEAEFEKFTNKQLESASRDLARMKSLVGKMPLKIAAIRAKTD